MFLEVLEVAENSTNLNVLRYSKKHLDTWMRNVISKNIYQQDFTSTTLVYWIINGLEDYPKCQNPSCNNKLCNVISVKEGYRRFCCQKCANSSQEVLQLREQRSLEKHGVPHFTNREKAQQTTMEHLGVCYPFQLKEIQTKAQQKSVTKYGVPFFMQTTEFREQAKDALVEEYGVDNIMKVPEKVIQAGDTKEEKYGDRNFNNRQQYKKTMLDTFGVESNFQLPEFKQMMHDRKDELTQKKIATLQKNYGMSHTPSFTYWYKEISFDSAPEVALFIWLEDHGVSFEYQPNIQFKYFDGKQNRSYCPDFEIEGKLVELKGNHFFEDKDPTKKMICPFNRSKDDEYEAKHQCMLANGVRILTGEDYKQYLDYVAEKYGKNYIKTMKRFAAE